MTLRHALLGLLSAAPASGYDLSLAFDGDLGRYAWQAGHSRIYPELVTMADQGLVAVESTGPRGRKSYALTDDGRTELRRWLLDPPEQGAVRNETVLRMFLVQALEPDDARRYLEAVADRCAAEIERLRSIMDSLDEHEGVDTLPYGRLAGEYSLRQNEAVASWAAWSLSRLTSTGGADVN